MEGNFNSNELLIDKFNKMWTFEHILYEYLKKSFTFPANPLFLTYP
jgi:hypothetical protein